MASKEERDDQSDQKKPDILLCSSCRRQTRTTAADKYCADCHDYYCLECVKVHNNFPALSGHKLFDKGQPKEGTSNTMPIVPTERCERHSFKPVDMYCHNHDEVGCYTCMAVEHRSCQDVFYIPEYVKENDTTTDYVDVQKNMQGTVNELKRQLDKYQREIKRLFKRKEKEVEKIKAFRVKIDRKLDVLEKKSIDDIEMKYQALIKKIEADSFGLTTSQEDVSSWHNSTISAGSNTPQHFVSTKRGNAVQEKARTCLADKMIEFARHNINFVCNQKLQFLLDDLNYLGETVQKHVLCKLENKKVYNVKDVSDTNTCHILSTCVLPGGPVIIADNRNKSLKRIDPSSYTVNKVFKLSNAPWQVCTTEKNEVAVCFGITKNISFVTVEGEMKVMKEIETNHSCYGIAYYNDNIFVTDSMTTLFVYSMTGTKLKEFSKDQTRQALFSDIYSLAVSNNGERIYVADKKYGIIALSKDGTLLGKYNCSELKLPREVCETQNGHVFVCGESSKNIIQFAPRGEVVGEVLSQDGCTGGCSALCYDRQHSRLILGRNSGDEIEIYDVA